MAQADGELYVLGELRGAMQNGSVQAMLGWLERRVPDEWGRRDKVAVQHGGQVDMQVTVRQIALIIDAALADVSADLRARVEQALLAASADVLEQHRMDGTERGAER